MAQLFLDDQCGRHRPANSTPYLDTLFANEHHFPVHPFSRLHKPQPFCRFSKSPVGDRPASKLWEPHPLRIAYLIGWESEHDKLRSRFSIWLARSAQESRLQRRCRAGARVGHRGEHCHLQRRERRPAAASAIRSAGPPGAALPHSAAGQLPRHSNIFRLAGQLSRLAQTGVGTAW